MTQRSVAERLDPVRLAPVDGDDRALAVRCRRLADPANAARRTGLPRPLSQLEDHPTDGAR